MKIEDLVITRRPANKWNEFINDTNERKREHCMIIENQSSEYRSLCIAEGNSGTIWGFSMALKYAVKFSIYARVLK